MSGERCQGFPVTYHSRHRDKVEVKLHSCLTSTLGVVGSQHYDPAALPKVCCEQKALWNSGPNWEVMSNPESSISKPGAVLTELPLLQQEGNKVRVDEVISKSENR